MILLYPGCLYRYTHKGLLENYERILSELGVEYIRLDDLVCCGMPLRFGGFSDDFVELARKNVELIHTSGVTEVVVLCPECHRLFEKHYKKFAGLNPDLEITFISCLLNEKSAVCPDKKGVVTYHDPCYLGRRSGIFEPPRELIGKLGFNLVEPVNTREEAPCCGGGGNVREHDSELSDAVARRRVQEFCATGADCIVTNCPHCYTCLSGKGMPVKDMAELW